MSDQLIDVRTPLAVSPHARVELGRDGVLHVLVGGVTLHLERGLCEELTTTLARAVVRLSRRVPRRAAKLSLVSRHDDAPSEDYGSSELPLGLLQTEE
jgi:hypothetical protein